MTANIKDVAARAKVSIATVSRFVNKTGQVHQKTAVKVQQAIDELGFRPNSVGRNLKMSTTRTLGVVIPSLSNPVFADSVAGITEIARQSDYSLMFTSTDYAPDAELQAVTSLLENRVTGLILTVADPENSPALNLLEAAKTPYILIYNQPGPCHRPTVTVDNVAAGRDVAKALIAMGHRRLGMISGAFASSDRASARRNGFADCIADAGLEPPQVQQIDFQELDATAAVASLFEDWISAPTALFCSNDLLAISVIGALERMGLNVPSDISVIGFDGITVGTHLHPKLSTVVQPSREMGRTATRQLLGRIDGEADIESVFLPYKLNLEESAGPSCKSSPADLQMPYQPTNRSVPQ